MKHPPIATFGLCLCTIGLALLPATAAQVMLFDITQMEQGNVIGMLGGHWLHVDTEHLLWNVSALAVLGAIIETCSRRLLFASLLIGMAGVDLLLLSPLGNIETYCGLSGILNTLLGVTLLILWQRTHSRIVLTVAALSLMKISVEIALGASLFTSTQWPPFALAHLAGLAAAPVAFFVGHPPKSYQFA